MILSLKQTGKNIILGWVGFDLKFSVKGGGAIKEVLTNVNPIKLLFT